ncbi:phosphoglycerate dehydrogenase [Nesterenkonia xinjiangensis]|uniref:D-3-phosphoglycerate dehydrogenase n=1 Tax=Nesterenkonia xinjiangensis TaxID=225327 RepID=A0A7Z0GP11_9MICC|nr:phosphoglycerate dehydrogenase [Nesterenkonia xinjiangensis]NYJ79511.1 D-3-phosphoglycerate dehydrogenase [Nesterenkonia xinjiangensis]
MKILVTPTSLSRSPEAAAMRRLRDAGAKVVINPHGRPLTPAELGVLLTDVDGVVAGLDHYTAEIIADAPRLKVISRYGVGTDRVDLEAARAAGVAVANAPGANSRSVAELTVGLMFAVARRIPMLDAAVADGGWPRADGIELGGRRLGVIGLGAIGRQVARAAAGLGMEVHGCDPAMGERQIRDLGIVPGSLDDVCARADVLTLHVPLTEGTRHLLDARRLGLLPEGAIVVNTARGGLLDEQAAWRALEVGRLHGVAVDAYESEPPQESPLVGHPRVVATPHSGAHTAEAVTRMADTSVENLLALLQGRPCDHRVV